MYSSVKSSIKFNDQISAPINSLSGLKQGDSNSSLLFIMFVNDIIDNIKYDLDDIFTIDQLKLFLLLFADDQALFSTSPPSLKSMLTDIEKYCDKWHLQINTKKTKVMIFEKGRCNTIHDFFLYNEKLENVTCFKYLGIYLFKNGSWLRSQKKLAENASKSLYGLLSTFNNFEFSVSKKCFLFDSLILPVMHYASEVWSYSSATDIESIHTKFCRRVLCVRKSTNLSGIYGELGRVPLIIIRKCNMIRYWLKIIKSPENSIIKKIYNMLRNDAELNITYTGLNCGHHVKTLLQSLGFNEVWINQSENSIKYETIKERIYDHYYQSWYSNINNSLRLSYYRIFKRNFVQEKYLDFIHDNKLRLSLSQFRISAHDLEIEKGRH